MNIDTTNTGVEELDFTEDSDRRRRKSDTVPPLDYVAKEMVNEFIEYQQEAAPPPEKSFVKKLFGLD
jgi:hypothetical protein